LFGLGSIDAWSPADVVLAALVVVEALVNRAVDPLECGLLVIRVDGMRNASPAVSGPQFDLAHSMSRLLGSS